ncbi:SEL1-like repeat protein [Iodobacter fluviatilis]|nr:DUF6396 domain-containing protein [Iodobacter fluviatilis]
MDKLENIKAKLAFSCAKEQDVLPELAAEPDLLFKYARYLDKNNILAQKESVYMEISRLYRIATAHGHYKASINLQNGMMRKKFSGDSIEMADWAQALIKDNIPAGYFLMGLYIKSGSAGIHQDAALALRYFRKAADMGNPDAQYYVGDKLSAIDNAPDVAVQMWQCAAEQGNANAATALGHHQSAYRRFDAAVNAFQLGVAAGDDSSALALEKGFRSPSVDSRLFYLALGKDEERAQRYTKIGDFLSAYSYAKPKVPDLDLIAPLPPAKLPKWDGTFQWLKEFKANIAPEKPSEALIKKLAEAKGLDVATGMPLKK